MQPVPEPFSASARVAPPGLILITQDQLGCAEAVATALAQKGITSALLEPTTLLNPERMAAQVEELRQRHGSVAGIVHLAPLALAPLPDTLEQWRQATFVQAKSLFHLLRLCAEDLQQAGQTQGACLLSASLLGGYFGRQGSGAGLPTGGAGVGLLKTLITEWSGVTAKAVDFDSSLSPEQMAQIVVQELLSGGRLEVGYPAGERTIFKTVSADLTPQDSVRLAPQADWVVLVTGGARGITAEIAEDLAKVGLTLVLVGRSHPEPESPQTAGITDVATLRKVLLQQALQAGEKPTPVQIESRVRQLQRDRAIRTNLERFAQAGATVEYFSADVRSESEFAAIIDGIYQRHGRLDAVIHGAGIIEDKLIVDKSPASFERVFDTKVDSLYLLCRHLRPESLKLLVLFSSVAGRYGNRGQSDYGAANETMNRLAWQLAAQWPHTRVVAINWGPWDTTGMASEEVKRQFRERGIVPIPLSAGRQFFRQEMSSGQPSEVEVIAGQGPWEAYEAEQAVKTTQSAAQPEAAPPAQSILGFLNTTPELQPNGSILLERTFTLASDPYLSDHCLDGNPVLPAAGALEWIAEIVQAAWPDWVVVGVRDLRVLRGLVLDAEAGKTVLLKARASTHADSASLTVTAEILDPQKRTPFYRAAVVLQPQLSPSPRVDLAPLQSGTPLDPAQAYRDYLFHGPRFQLVQSIERLNEQGIDARVLASDGQAWLDRARQGKSAAVRWLFDPGLIDTAPQLAIVWARVQLQTTALPSRLGSVMRYQAPAPATALQMAFRVKSADDHALTYEAVFFDQDGYVHFQLAEIESTCNSQLNRLARQS